MRSSASPPCPHRSRSVAVAEWPTGADLIGWVGQPVSAGRESLYDTIVGAAIDVVMGDLDMAKMPDQTSLNPCPESVRMAVLILAARIDSRRQSTNGVIAAGDLFVRVSRDDPDYRNLIARYAVSAEP